MAPWPEELQTPPSESQGEEPTLDEVDGMLMWNHSSTDAQSTRQSISGPSVAADELDGEVSIDSEDDEMLRALEPFGGSWKHSWNEDLTGDAVTDLRNKAAGLEEEKKSLLERLHQTEMKLVESTTNRRSMNRGTVICASKNGQKSPRKATTSPSRSPPRQASPSRARTTTSASRKIVSRNIRSKAEVFKDLRAVFDEQCCLGEFEIKSAMNDNKFYRLLRDCQVKNERITNTVIDLMYKKLTTAKGTKVMGFPIFLTALKEIALIRYNVSQAASNSEKMNTMLRLAEEYIIPMARPDDMLHEARLLRDPRVGVLLKHSHSSLKAIFDWYSQSGVLKTGGDNNPTEAVDLTTENEEMSLQELIKFAQDFDLVPDLLSVLQLAQIFRIVNRTGDGADSNGNNCNYPEWLEVVGRIALRGYDRKFEGKPNAKKNPTPGDKIQHILDHMQASSGIQVSICKSGFTLFPKGRKPPVEMEDAAVRIQTCARARMSRNRVRKLLNPDEAEVDEVDGPPRIPIRPRHIIMKELRIVFSEQCCIGEMEVKHSMSGNKFYRLVRDCKITSPTCTNVMVDLLFKKITAQRAQEIGAHEPMDFELFLTALKNLGQRRLRIKDAQLAMLTLVDKFILPKMKIIDSEMEGKALREIEVAQIWRQSGKPIRDLYNHWASGDNAMGVQGRSAAEQLLEMTEMSLNEFISFARAFDLIPNVASIYQIGFLFREVNRSEVADDNVNDLSFEEFLEMIGRCAIRWFDKKYDKYGNERGNQTKQKLSQNPVITAQKVLTLLQYMETSKGVGIFQVATGRSSFTFFPRGSSRRKRLWLSKSEASAKIQATWRMRRTSQEYKAYQKLQREKEFANQPKSQLKRKRREIMKDLRLIFEESCSMWELEVTHVMSSSKFYKLMRDCKILTGSITTTYLDLLYSKATTENHEAQGGLSYHQFTGMLREVASKRLKIQNHTMALLVLTEDYIVPNVKSLLESFEAETTDIMTAIEDQLFVELFKKSDPAIKSLYEYYATVEHVGNKVGRSVEEINAEFIEISCVELERFCRDFEIVPVFFSRVEMAKIFRLVNRQQDMGVGMVDENANNLSFEEFKQVLIRMAIRAYDSKFKNAHELHVWYEKKNMQSGHKELKDGEVNCADKTQWLMDYMDEGPGPGRFCQSRGRTLFTLFPNGRAKRPLTTAEAATHMQKCFRGFFSRSGRAEAVEKEAEMHRIHEAEHAHWMAMEQAKVDEKARAEAKALEDYTKQHDAETRLAEAQARFEYSRSSGSPRGHDEDEELVAPRPRPVGSAGRMRPHSGNLETVVEERESEREDSPGDKPRGRRGRRKSISDSTPPPLEGRTEYVPGRSMGNSRR